MRRSEMALSAQFARTVQHVIYTCTDDKRHIMHTPVPLLSANHLLQCYRKSRRTGRWRRLSYRDKALFRASLDYLKRGGRILNESLLVKLERLVDRLTETRGQRIVKRGLAKAAALLTGVEKGLFGWVPRMKAWLKDPDYIFWLGAVG